MGGGGGDDYGAQQAAMEAKKQQARDSLNAVFGIAPTGGAGGAAAMPAVTSPHGGQWVSDGAGYSMQPYPEPTPTPAPDPSAPVPDTVAQNKAGRDALYQTVRDNAFGAGKRRFDENKDKASRDLSFTLFAQGLNGGSADVDENALLNRTYTQGLLDVGSKADAARTDMMGNDENTRLGLLQSVDNGMDQGSALSSALNQLKVNSDRAASSAQGTDVGDLFANAGLLYSKSNAAITPPGMGGMGGMGFNPYSLFGGQQWSTGYGLGGRGGASGGITPSFTGR